jgi:hypothetical protein
MAAICCVVSDATSSVDHAATAAVDCERIWVTLSDEIVVLIYKIRDAMLPSKSTSVPL